MGKKAWLILKSSLTTKSIRTTWRRLIQDERVKFKFSLYVAVWVSKGNGAILNTDLIEEIREMWISQPDPHAQSLCSQHSWTLLFVCPYQALTDIFTSKGSLLRDQNHSSLCKNEAALEERAQHWQCASQKKVWEARLCKASKLQKKVQFLAGGCEVVWKCSLLILCCSLPGQSPGDDLERCKSCLKWAEHAGLRAQSSQLELPCPGTLQPPTPVPTPAHPPLVLPQPGRGLGTHRPEPLTEHRAWRALKHWELTLCPWQLCLIW